MAGIIGGQAGYATVSPTRNYVGEALVNVQDGLFRQNAQRVADERTKSDAERQAINDRRKNFEDAQEFAKSNPFIATETGLDASNRQSYMNAKSIASEARANFMATGDQKYNAIYQNAISSVEHLSEIPKKLNALKEDWVKNVANYNPQSLLKKGELIDKLGNGDIVQTNDANGNPRYSIFNRDAEGNLEKVAYKEISGQQLLALLEPVKSFNVTGDKGLIDQFQKRIGKAIPKEEIKGGQIVKSLYTPGSEEVAKTMAQAATQNKAAVYSALQELGLDPEKDSNYTDANVLKEVANHYETLLNKNAPNIETSRLPNYEEQKIAISKEAKAETARHQKVMEGKEKAGSTTVVEEQATHKVTGKPLFDGNGNPVMTKRVSVTTPNKSGNTQRAPTKAELKAKADALRAKYAPKK
jgi:hypothetical protein